MGKITLTGEFCDGVTDLEVNNYSNGITFGYILSSIITFGGIAMARGEKAREYFGCKLQLLSNSMVAALRVSSANL